MDIRKSDQRRLSVPNLRRNQCGREHVRNAERKRLTFSTPSLRASSFVESEIQSAPSTPIPLAKAPYFSSSWNSFPLFRNDLASGSGSFITRNNSQDEAKVKDDAKLMTQANSVLRGPTDPDGSAGAPLGLKNLDNAEVTQTSRSSKARQKKFHRHFKQVDIDEKVLNYYSCALVGDILLQGHLYITENFFAFYSNVFGYVTKLLIPAADVLKISKEKTAKIIPNAVGISTEDEKHVFGSLLSRDSTYKFMVEVWKAANSSQPVSNIATPEVIKPDASDEDSTGSSANEAPTSFLTSLTSGSGEEFNLQKLFPSLKKGSVVMTRLEVKNLNGRWFSMRTTGVLVILVALLALLFASAGYLLYRIALIQDNLSTKDLSSFSRSTSRSEIYEDVLKWQSALHSTSANKIQELLALNLNQIVKIRLSLEALSVLILPKGNDSDKQGLRSEKERPNLKKSEMKQEIGGGEN